MISFRPRHLILSFWRYLLTISLCLHILAISLEGRNGDQDAPHCSTPKENNAAFGLDSWWVEESRDIYLSSESTDMGREPRHVAMSAGQSATLKPSESFRGDPTLPRPSHKTDTNAYHSFLQRHLGIYVFELCTSNLWKRKLLLKSTIVFRSWRFFLTYIVTMLIRSHCTGPFLPLSLGGLTQSLVLAKNL